MELNKNAIVKAQGATLSICSSSPFAPFHGATWLFGLPQTCLANRRNAVGRWPVQNRDYARYRDPHEGLTTTRDSSWSACIFHGDLNRRVPSFSRKPRSTRLVVTLAKQKRSMRSAINRSLERLLMTWTKKQLIMASRHMALRPLSFVRMRRPTLWEKVNRLDYGRCFDQVTASESEDECNFCGRASWPGGDDLTRLFRKIRSNHLTWTEQAAKPYRRGTVT